MRSAGLFLPVSALPGPYGIGDFGNEAIAFLATLAAAQQSHWQILSLTTTDALGSPFASASAFALNWQLVSPEQLHADGWLTADARDGAHSADGRVEYGSVSVTKRHLIGLAWASFRQRATEAQRADFDAFCRKESPWLATYALFMALKDRHGGAPWTDWEQPLRDRVPEALAQWSREHEQEIDYFRFGQWLAFTQWQRVRGEAARRGIRIIGDLPYFMRLDSADVWEHRDWFVLDEHGRARVVAGVPPDILAEHGQLWGNPCYRWDGRQTELLTWWEARTEHAFRLYDGLRLDHFRGYMAVWEVPAADETPERGSWTPVPGDALLGALLRRHQPTDFIAEDLGYITGDVLALRDRYGLPGMRVVEFGFNGDEQNPHFPPNYPAASVAFTSTHDAPTLAQWLAASSETERRLLLQLCGGVEPWDVIGIAMGSASELCIMPVQDLLGLGAEARTNTPGTTTNNWSWRLPAAIPETLVDKLAALTSRTQRARPDLNRRSSP